VQLRFPHSCGSLLWLERLVALIFFLLPKLFFRCRSGSLGLLVRVVFVCFAISASTPSHYTVLSDRHLAQPGLCPIVSGLCPIIIWLSLVSVRSCWVSVRSSFGSAWSLSDCAGPLSDHRLAQPGLCPIVPGLYPIIILLSFFLLWCVAGPILSVICYSGRVLSLISHVVFLAPFQVSGAVPSTVPRPDS
jgi:hypothetical protein